MKAPDEIEIKIEILSEYQLKKSMWSIMKNYNFTWE